MRRFMFRLAGHLGMTVAELGERMDSRELTEWIAYHRFHEPFGDEWRQTGMIISGVLAPYCRNSIPKPETFMPLSEMRQDDQDLAIEMEKLQRIADAIKEQQGG